MRYAPDVQWTREDAWERFCEVLAAAVVTQQEGTPTDVRT